MKAAGLQEALKVGGARSGCQGCGEQEHGGQRQNNYRKGYTGVFQ